jgi:hypothetical protein
MIRTLRESVSDCRAYVGWDEKKGVVGSVDEARRDAPVGRPCMTPVGSGGQTAVERRRPAHGCAVVGQVHRDHWAADVSLTRL